MSVYSLIKNFAFLMCSPNFYKLKKKFIQKTPKISFFKQIGENKKKTLFDHFFIVQSLNWLNPYRSCICVNCEFIISRILAVTILWENKQRCCLRFVGFYFLGVLILINFGIWIKLNRIDDKWYRRWGGCSFLFRCLLNTETKIALRSNLIRRW